MVAGAVPDFVACSERQPESATRIATPTPLSKTLWGIDWQAENGWAFDEIRVNAVPFDDVVPFMREHYAGIFETAKTGFFQEEMTAAKSRFGELSDAFAFRNGDSVIGILICHPTDWSTYYVRTTAFLPAYRDRRLLPRFLFALEARLRDLGIDRLQADISPLNAPACGVVTSLGWTVTAHATSERWGVTLQWTKFLRPEPREVFVQQFAAMSFVPSRDDGQRRRR